MSDRDNPRSLVEIMNDVLSTVREHYDSEYVYYIEKEYEDIDVIYEWCAKHVPWQRDKIKMLPKDQRPRWMEQEITDTTEDSYSVFRRLDENTVAILAAVGVHRGGCEVDLLRSVLAYLPEAITLQKLQKQQEYLSYHDKLTGLYNRNSFVSYTTDINPDELNSLGAVSVDINGLKNFNKEFGRDYGDEVVIRVGEVLEEYFHTANVYRMTGDEYLVLVENITYEEFMKQVHGTYTKLDNISLGLASLGCAWEKIDIDVDALVLSAENMMREEKKSIIRICGRVIMNRSSSRIFWRILRKADLSYVLFRRLMWRPAMWQEQRQSYATTTRILESWNREDILIFWKRQDCPIIWICMFLRRSARPCTDGSWTISR